MREDQVAEVREAEKENKTGEMKKKNYQWNG